MLTFERIEAVARRTGSTLVRPVFLDDAVRAFAAHLQENHCRLELDTMSPATFSIIVAAFFTTYVREHPEQTFNLH